MSKDIRITKCYYVEHIDSNGKALCSDFCFGNREEAKKVGEELKRTYKETSENDGVVLGA